MSEHPISRFPVPELGELPDDIRDMALEIQEKTGFVPNVFLALAHRPAEFRAFFAYHDALMAKETPGLSKADREMIVVATSARNQCLYCVISHGAVLRIRTKDPLVADQVAVNHREADIEPRQVAMLDLAVKVALESHTVTPADLDALAEHGFSREDVWDIGAIAAFFAMSNRLASFAGIPPNAEFYGMAR